MVVMNLLFGTDIGILSLFTIGFVIAMGVYFVVVFSRKARNNE